MDQAAGEPGRSSDAIWNGEHGQVRASRPAPGVVLYAFSGRMTPELVERIRDYAAEEIGRAGRVDVFFDTEAMTGYHPEFRDRMTEWHAAIKPQTRSANVLVRSTLISMAIAIANLVTGGLLKSHSTRRTFESALSDACRAARAARPS